VHIEPQGVVHSKTPDSGSGDDRRPMLIAKTDPMKPPLDNNPWPIAAPPSNTSSPSTPPAPADLPLEPIVLIPGPIMKRYS
jgi:hypothetical protein